MLSPRRRASGTMGRSQGGYISAFLATHDAAPFKAISVGAGISDWMTYYVNTENDYASRLILPLAAGYHPVHFDARFPNSNDVANRQHI